MTALQNRIREAFPRELEAVSRRARDRRVNPSAPALEFRGFEKWERLARAEEAQRTVEIVRRDPKWRGDSRLDQWVERIYCMSLGAAGCGAFAAVIPLGPIDVMGGSGNIVGFLAAELGITTATGVSAWASQIGGTALDMSQATGGNQPVYNTNDATIWGRPSVASDGVDDVMGCTWDPPVPGTTPTWISCIANRRVDASGDVLFAVASTRMIVQRSTATQVIASNGTASGAVTMSVATWYRTETLWNNSTTDYLKVGANSSTGTNMANNDPAATFRLFATSAAGASSGAFSLQRVLALNVAPTALQKALFDATHVRRYNGNISV